MHLGSAAGPSDTWQPGAAFDNSAGVQVGSGNNVQVNNFYGRDFPTPAEPGHRTGELAPVFRIGLLGPARIGKTALITALLEGTPDQLAGTGLTICPADPVTGARLAQNRRHLDGGIAGGKFTTVSLRPMSYPFTFRLTLDPGVPDAEISIEVLDFPGGWVNPADRPPQAASEWRECREFVTQSTILAVPVDATLLMEAARSSHYEAMDRLLSITQVEEVARDWAIERSRRRAELAQVVFCPVKCETYFNDNGGQRNRAAELSRRFRDAYGAVITAIKDEAPHATLLYAPVDTIGCVEVESADWPVDDGTGEATFAPSYRIRAPHRISRIGTDDLLRAICQHLVEARRTLDARDAEILAKLAAEARESASLDQGFIRNARLWLTSEQSAREQAAWTRSREAEAASRRVTALDAVIRRIAESRFGPRTEVL